MANNRLFLYHPGSGKRVLIAKRLGSEFYTGYSDLSERLDKFFEEVPFRDDRFVLCAEHSEIDGRWTGLPELPFSNTGYENHHDAKGDGNERTSK